MELKDCFREDFSIWLNNSNHPKIKPYITHQSKLNKVVEESLSDILDILLREPQADYFWYGYPEHGGKLSYSLPHHDVVPGNAIRIDKEKIKVFLRDIKIETLLNE
jgi:hypothetical protein